MFCAYSHLGSVRRKPTHNRYIARTRPAVERSPPREATSFQFDVLRDLSHIISKSPRNVRRVIEHNASSRAFFNPQRINDVLSRTKATITANGISVSLPMRKHARHLIDITFNACTPTNSNLLAPLIGHQIELTRHFKTDRSIAAEIKRNPTILSRLKTAFGGNPHKLEAELSHAQADTLKKLLKKGGEQGQNKNEVDNIKIAFAEGYLAASNSDESSKSGKL